MKIEFFETGHVFALNGVKHFEIREINFQVNGIPIEIEDSVDSYGFANYRVKPDIVSKIRIGWGFSMISNAGDPLFAFEHIPDECIKIEDGKLILNWRDNSDSLTDNFTTYVEGKRDDAAEHI